MNAIFGLFLLFAVDGTTLSIYTSNSNPYASIEACQQDVGEMIFQYEEDLVHSNPDMAGIMIVCDTEEAIRELPLMDLIDPDTVFGGKRSTPSEAPGIPV